MIDHLLGRPSNSWKRVQVVLVIYLWLLFLRRGHAHGPVQLRRLSRRLSGSATAWQIFCLSMTSMYLLKNMDRLLGLGAAEPLARLYSRSFYRATWLITALDAGFLTALPIQNVHVRNIASILFSLYYLIFADQADVKVRKIQATMTVDQIRASWQKTTDNYFLKHLLRISTGSIQVLKKVTINRPSNSAYKAPTVGWLYFDGSSSELENASVIVLNFPGGGYVSMSPRNFDESLMTFARKLKVPVLSIDYKKAPEYPYPYALDECYDVYVRLLQSNGNDIGIKTNRSPKICMVGDSAGGNFVAGVTLKLVSYNEEVKLSGLQSGLIQLPCALVLIYPNLDFTMTSWMSEDQLQLIKNESLSDVKNNIWNIRDDFERRRSASHLQSYGSLTKITSSPVNTQNLEISTPRVQKSTKKTTAATLLSMTSRVAFFQDRMRAMAILYIGPENTPDFDTDYLLSPLRAPAAYLAQFPKTYIMSGEKDPLVDDSIILAGRIREAKKQISQRNQTAPFNPIRDEPIKMMLVKLVSHGFIQMSSFLPEARVAINKLATWIEEGIKLNPAEYRGPSYGNSRMHTESLCENEDGVLEIGSTKRRNQLSNEEESFSQKTNGDKNNEDTWETRNVIQAAMLMDRRRAALVSGLHLATSRDNNSGHNSLTNSRNASHNNSQTTSPGTM